MKADVRERFERLERRLNSLLAAATEIALRQEGTNPPPPFKFEVGDKVFVPTHGEQTVRMRWRDVDGCPVYQLNGTKSMREEHLTTIPSPPRFKVGDWVRIKKGTLLFQFGPMPVGRIVELQPNPPNCKGVDCCRFIDTKGNSWSPAERNLEPWQPRIGELVMERQPNGGWSLLRFGQPHNYSGIIPAPLGGHAQEWFR